jgi:hypothetical protein
LTTLAKVKVWSITYDRNHSIKVLATVVTIVNYNCKTFIVEATGRSRDLTFKSKSEQYFSKGNTLAYFARASVTNKRVL